MEMHYSNTCLSIYEMGEAPTFVIKRDVLAFVMGDGIGDMSAFMIKGNTCLFYLHNRRYAIVTCVSLLSEKRVHLEY
jgi:hypothetical protein